MNFAKPLLFLLLAGCAAPQAIVRTQTVTVKVPAFVPLSETLIAPVQKPEPPAGAITNNDLLTLAIQRGNAIDQANSQLDAIRKLQPKGKDQ